MANVPNASSVYKNKNGYGVKPFMEFEYMVVASLKDAPAEILPTTTDVDLNSLLIVRDGVSYSNTPFWPTPETKGNRPEMHWSKNKKTKKLVLLVLDPNSQEWEQETFKVHLANTRK